MRISFLCLAVLLIVPPTGAAPAPDPGRKAREKLEALKKVLPPLLDKWVQEPDSVTWLWEEWKCKPELRSLRRIGLNRAKALILFAAYDHTGERNRVGDVVLTIFLSYHDRCWTIDQFEAGSRIEPSQMSKARGTFSFLMLAIDEAAEK